MISAKLTKDWSLDRLDRPMRAILRAGTYELLARPDVPVGSVISEYVDVAHAFYDKRGGIEIRRKQDARDMGRLAQQGFAEAGILVRLFVFPVFPSVGRQHHRD